MEQIDLRLVIANPYSRWSKADEFERNEKLARFPHSVLVATSFREVDYSPPEVVTAPLADPLAL